MHTRGDEGQPKTWIDHVLHKGGEEHIQLTAGYVSHSPLWEGITDNRPLWGVFKVCPAAQKVPKAAEARKVRWELYLTDKGKCDGFVERMEEFEQTIPKPTDESSMEEVFDYMQKMHTHISATVKSLYQRAGQLDTRGSYKHGWSPTFCMYKAHLTALVHIRRRVMGYKGRTPWSSVEQMRVDLRDIIDDWETTLSGVELPEEQTRVIRHCVERTMEWWKATSMIPTTAQIDEDMCKIKYLIHGS